VRRLLPTLAIALLAAGCGGTKTLTVTETTTVTRPSAAGATVRVYFLRDGKVAPVARSPGSIAATILAAAVDAGPTAAERAAGFAPATGRGRLAALVYTLSQFDPRAPVEVEGKRYTRADFEDLTPTILVEAPLPFQPVSSPLRVMGTANTFEATFDYELLDAGGKVLSHHFETATSGSGTRGTFDFTVPFTAPNGPGRLVLFEESAADGSRIHQVEIPLTLTR